jgi:Integrase zinc binding domain
LSKKDKICVPLALQEHIVAWYHKYLAHPGINRTELTIRQLFTWPRLKHHVEKYCSSYRICHTVKLQRKQHGHLPIKNSQVEPWNRVDVDLIGPWNVKAQTGPKSLRCLSIIDPATYWFEIIPIRNPTAADVMEAFTNEWLSRYPRPQYIGFDNGSEFKSVFIQTCINYGIMHKNSTSHNPQSNGIIERVHSTLGNMLRSFEMQNKTQN